MVKLLYITAISLKKIPPKQFLKSNYHHTMSIISFYHKDAIGRNKNNDWRWKFITKTDIVNQIWNDNIDKYTKRDIEFIVNSFIKIIGERINNDLKVKIEGLGSFSTYYRDVHFNKSLNNDYEKNIPSVKYIRFKPSKKLKKWNLSSILFCHLGICNAVLLHWYFFRLRCGYKLVGMMPY